MDTLMNTNNSIKLATPFADPTKGAMSPLADPVISAIFANETVAGLAAESLVTAILETDNSKNEVISMTPELQTYAEKNPGFTQFDQRYRHETASPELRSEYVSWVLSEMKVEGAREGGWIDGHAAGRAAGRMEGHAEGHTEGRTEGFDISVEVIRLLRKGETAEGIANKLNIPISQVNKLQALV